MPALDVVAFLIAGVSALGVAGLAVAFVFAPAIATVVLQGLTRFAAAVVSTRAGCVAIAALATFMVTDLHRRQVARVECDARIETMKAAAAVAAQKRDAEIAAAIGAQYTPVVAELERQAGELQGKVAEYEKRILGDAGAGRCVLGPDALRLRHDRRR